MLTSYHLLEYYKYKYTNTQIHKYTNTQIHSVHQGSIFLRMKCGGRRVAKFWSCCRSSGMHVGEDFTLCKISAKFAPAQISFTSMPSKWKNIYAINCKTCCMIDYVEIVGRVSLCKMYGWPILKGINMHALLCNSFLNIL